MAKDENRRVARWGRRAALGGVPIGIGTGLRLMGFATPGAGVLLVACSLAWGLWALLTWPVAANWLERREIKSVARLLAVGLWVLGLAFSVWSISWPDEQDLVLAVQHDPEVRIEPATMASGRDGEFMLTFVNSGIPAIEEIGIFVDPYVAVKPKDGPPVLHRFGMFSMEPNVRFAFMASKDEPRKFLVSLRTVITEMNQLFNTVAGSRLEIVSILVRFRRAVDGRTFSYSRVYIVAGGGSGLVDLDAMLPPAFSPMVGFSRDELRLLVTNGR